MKMIFNEVEYEVVKNVGDCIDNDLLLEKITDYYTDFDYIVGDWAYGKVRLKGFFEPFNNKVSNINNIDNLDNYISNYCAYGCKWFLLKKKKRN